MFPFWDEGLHFQNGPVFAEVRDCLEQLISDLEDSERRPSYSAYELQRQHLGQHTKGQSQDHPLQHTIVGNHRVLLLLAHQRLQVCKMRRQAPRTGSLELRYRVFEG